MLSKLRSSKALLPICAVLAGIYAFLSLPASVLKSAEAMLVYGSSSGNPQVVGATSNALNVSVASGTVAAANGGTGISSYTIGDMLYASGTTTLAKLAAVATGQVLTSAGTGTAPAWSPNISVTGSIASGSGQNITAGNALIGSVLRLTSGSVTITPSAATHYASHSKSSIGNASATTIASYSVTNSTTRWFQVICFEGSLGAGGDVGAGEAVATGCYNVVIARVANVDTVATLSTAYATASSVVTGGATITAVLTLTAPSGTSSSTQTFDLQATITRGSGSSTNHQLFWTSENTSATSAVTFTQSS